VKEFDVLDGSVTARNRAGYGNLLTRESLLKMSAIASQSGKTQ
jgi:hypothetical protein